MLWRSSLALTWKMIHLQFGKVYFYRAFYWYFCEVHGTKGSFRSIFFIHLWSFWNGWLPQLTTVKRGNLYLIIYLASTYFTLKMQLDNLTIKSLTMKNFLIFIFQCKSWFYKIKKCVDILIAFVHTCSVGPIIIIS